MPPTYVSPNPLTGRYEDAVHRICDDINTVLAAEGFDVAGEWMIFGLDDGKPWIDTPENRHQHYPSPIAACAHWKSARPAILYQITPEGATPRGVAIWLKMNRQAYDAGYRITTGTYEPNLIMDVPLRIEDLPR
jgi:hypothetical protein